MDILSRLPLEIAFQILSKLDILDITSCQRVSRHWYWITVDQSIWRNVYQKNEEKLGVPLKYDWELLNTLTPKQRQSAKTMNWKQHCRNRFVSDRNWSNGHIQSLFTLRVHRGGIVRLRIKGSKLLSGDAFGHVAVWDTTTYTCESFIEASAGPIHLMDFSEKHMIMAVISKSGIYRIWDLKTKAIIHSSSAIGVTCMTMDDNNLVLGTRDCQLQIFDFSTGQILRTSDPIHVETLQEIYIQNDTLIVATGHFIRILSINTFEVFLSCPLPIPENTLTFCSVFHIRSLILLTDSHLHHVEWEPLYKSPSRQFTIVTHRELPPNLNKAPSIHKTKIPPISTITSIAIGGKHTHVLTANADRPSLNGAIRVCPTSPYSSGGLSHQDQILQSDQTEIWPNPPTSGASSSNLISAGDHGVVLTSQVQEISEYLETCGLKPSFMDVDEGSVIIGTSKGDIVVLSMAPQGG